MASKYSEGASQVLPGRLILHPTKGKIILDLCNF